MSEIEFRLERRVKQKDDVRLFLPSASTPVLRGTALVVDRRHGFLWTRGYVPRLAAYQRFGTPKPITVGRLLPEEMQRTLVAGDFNQRVPQRFQYQAACDALTDTLLSRMTHATSGDIAPMGKQAIDHIFHSRDLGCDRVTGLSNIADDGRLVSDHFGVICAFRHLLPVGLAGPGSIELPCSFVSNGAGS